MSYIDEFQTVDLIVNSNAETRGVDAFALSLIKAERQIRRLFTYLAFQFPAFSPADIFNFRDTLAQNKKVYFDGFIRGIDALYPRSVQDMIGPDFLILERTLKQAIEYRNKIFHGQLTNQYLTRDDLLEFVSSIRIWCEKLADEALTEFDYDGFKWNSLQKATTPIWQRYKVTISSLDEYRAFIRDNMQR